MGTTKLKGVGLLCITAVLGGCTNEGEVGGAAEEVHDVGLFELDGNAVDSPAGLPDDWANVANDTDSAFSTTFLSETGNVTTFTGGGSKDNLGIQSGAWQHKNGSVPPKDDLANAYAAAYTDPDTDDFIVYFGADRNFTNGSAQLGFWFFQEQVSAAPGGSFTGQHTDGDLLILAEFVQGGAVSNILVLQWVGDDATGHLETLLDVDNAQCGLQANDDVCAITNNTTVNLPWRGDVGPQAFFEGGINITALFPDSDVPCFASFMAETRSSHEVNATLKDFILGEFEACDISITKTCEGGEFDNTTGLFTYTFSGTVTNIGAQTLYDVTVYETHLTADESDDTVIATIPTLAAGATANYGGTFTSPLSSVQNETRVTAAASAGGEVVLNVTIDEPVQCSAPELTPVIHVTKDCTVRLDDTSGQVVVVVDFGGQVCNEDELGTDGEVTLTDVIVWDTKCTADTADDVIIDDTIADLGPGACEDYNDSYTPSSSTSTDPLLAPFTDCVIATATSFFGSVSDTDDADCALCPPPAPPG